MGKLLLTGASGFLGRSFQKQYTGTNLFPVDIHESNDGVCAVDLMDSGFAAFLPENIDGVVHLAAVSNDRACKESPHEAWALNLVRTLELYKECAKRGCRKFLFASTEWVYGDQSPANAWREFDPLSPHTLGVYALSKLTAEYALQQIVQEGCEVLIYRLAILYGKRISGQSAVESIACNVARNEPVEVYSGETARCYLHVDDAAQAMILGMQTDIKGVFNVTGNALVSLRDVYTTSCDISGNHPGFQEIKPEARTVRNVDGSRLTDVLGWKPRDLRQGLLDLMGSQGCHAGIVSQ